MKLKPACPTTGGAALITGASSGIGFALANQFSAAGISLVLTARDAERLERAANEIRDRYAVEVITVPSDLSFPGSAKALFDAVTRTNRDVEFLINNAGIGLLGEFRSTSLEEETAMMRLNMEALITLSKLFIPGMLRRQRGRILNVCSLAARQPGGPGAAVYFATKAFVLAFSNGLGTELHGTGVTVTALCPGPTDTPFKRRSGFDKTVSFNPFMTARAEDVARSGYRAMLRGEAVCYPGLMSKVFALASALLPRRPALALNRLFLTPRPLPSNQSSTLRR